MPRFSVVVPTRDRPDLLEFCLEGLAAQTFADFEVVVSDNSTRLPARAAFDRWARPGWHYVRPAEPVPMHDNFERACAEARGEYLAVVIDKTVLQPSALEVADAGLGAEPADIVTWWNNGYDPLDELRDIGPGHFTPAGGIVPPSLYDPRAELATRFANVTRRGVDAVHYVRGKIVFGAFSKRLVERIRERNGRLFYPLAPDYTSMVPACFLADRGLDLGRPLLVSYNSVTSNGQRQSYDPRHARAFIEASDPAIVDALPIAGLYASQHNVVAHDLASSAARCGATAALPLDLRNLVRRAREDLDGVVWPDADERRAQYAILERAESELGVTPEPAPVPKARQPRKRDALAETLARFPRAQRAVHRVLRREHSGPLLYASPVEAARAADLHYAAFARH